MKEKEPVYNLEVAPLARWLAAGLETALGVCDAPAIPRARCSELLALAGVIALPVTASACVGGGAAMWLVCRALSAAINRMRRPKYYERERLRRRELRAQRRKIVPRSTQNPCPTPGLLAELWKNRRRSGADMVRLGSALLDLDAYVDSRLRFDPDGRICGRNPGVKGWLFEHCPDIWAHYKTAMRYKQLAVKLRQAAGLADPYPAEAALGGDGGEGTGPDETTRRNEIGGAPLRGDGMRLRGGEERGAADVEKAVPPGWEFVRGAGPANNLPLARAVARAVMDGGGGMSGLMARLNRRLDENFGLKTIGPAG